MKGRRAKQLSLLPPTDEKVTENAYCGFTAFRNIFNLKHCYKTIKNNVTIVLFERSLRVNPLKMALSKCGVKYILVKRAVRPVIC